MSFAKRFGRNLARCRKAKGISQEELAFQAELHRTEIGMIERGLRLPRIDTLTKIADSLGVTPGELLAGLVWKPRESSPGEFQSEEGEES
jgi:transcriptional regulator with XRE-family HTH domain